MTFRVLILSDALVKSSGGASASAWLLAALRHDIHAAGGGMVVHELTGLTGPWEGLRAAIRDAPSIILLSTRADAAGKLGGALADLAPGQLRRKPVGLAATCGETAVDRLRLVLAGLGAVVIPRAVVVADVDPLAPGDRMLNGVHAFTDELAWFVRTLRQDTEPCPLTEPVAAGGRASPHIGRAVAYIRANFCDGGLTLERAARAAHMSRCHFSRTFKKETGRGFMEFVTELRMHRAQELLARTELTVAEVCRRVGYRDIGHFQRTFKNSFAMSPSRYRLVVDETPAPRAMQEVR